MQSAWTLCCPTLSSAGFEGLMIAAMLDSPKDLEPLCEGLCVVQRLIVARGCM